MKGYCVQEEQLGVAGAAGVLLHTRDSATVGLLVGYFRGPGISLWVILPLHRLLIRVKTDCGVNLELIPMSFDNDW